MRWPLLGKLSRRQWRDGERSDRRWARTAERKLFDAEVADAMRWWRGESVQTEPVKPTPKGMMCRCLDCCCKPGEGHKDPAWIAHEAALKAARRDGR